MSLISLTTDPAEDGESNSADPQMLAAVVDFITSARGHLSAVEAAVKSGGHDLADQAVIDAALRSFHSIKGVASFLGLDSVIALAHATEGVLEGARRGESRRAGGTAEAVLTAVGGMREMIDELERDVPDRQPVSTPAALNSLIQQVVTPAEGPERVTDAARSLESLASRDMSILGPNDPRVAGRPGRVARDLQGPAAPTRTVVLQPAFERMARVLRDLCRRTGKEIDLEIEGGETEADRAVADAIAEPLVHMVRNAADHGIEPAEARELAGKLRAGRITLRAYHQAGTVVIEISDDGRGLRKEQIVAKAVELGVVRPDEAEGLTEQQVFQLIFHPGLSTAYAVSEISGRGVGMDVVKHDIEALNGRIEIASKEKVGTTFTIRLPLTSMARAA